MPPLNLQQTEEASTQVVGMDQVMLLERFAYQAQIPQ
jgi:hypothetical protein